MHGQIGHGIPETITTDGGPPYNGEEFKKFAQNMGFTHRRTTPESAQANGFAEIFVKTLVKLIHTAVADKKDPRRAVQSYLMAYRATPHTVTGRSPAELLFNRSIQTKLPRALREEQSAEDRAEGIFNKMDVNSDGKVTRFILIKICIKVYMNK